MVTWNTYGTFTTSPTSVYRSGGSATWNNSAWTIETQTTGLAEFSCNLASTPTTDYSFGLTDGQPSPSGQSITAQFAGGSSYGIDVMYNNIVEASFTNTGQTIKITYDFSSNEYKWYNGSTLVHTQSHSESSVNVAYSSYTASSSTEIENIVFGDDPPSATTATIPPPPAMVRL
jgi:hypothetical protein